MEMNPILAFKDKERLTWEELADRTGVSLAHMRRLATRDANSLMRTKLETLFILEEKLGIELVDFIKQHAN